MHDGQGAGVALSGNGTEGRLERCELWGNAKGGVRVSAGSEVALAACALRDHAVGRAAGVHVCVGGRAAVGADCSFARNAGGDVVRRKTSRWDVAVSTFAWTPKIKRKDRP